MRKIINFYSIILVVIFLSVPVEGSTTIGGKSFFAPQSLMAMLAPLSMRSSLIIGDNEPKKTLFVHLRPLVQQPKLLAPVLPPAKISALTQLQERIEFLERAALAPKKEVKINDSHELAMPHADEPTIPLNEVKSPSEATIPLNDLVEAPIMPSALSYDAPNLNNNVDYLTPDKTQSGDKNMNLDNMQIVSKPTPNKGFIFGMVPFYIKSTNGPDLRHYFFPEGKDELGVKESLPAAANEPDFSGTWLNIVGTNATSTNALLENNFQSTLQISPVYEYVGAHLHLRKQMGQYWSDVQLPIAQVSVDHGIKEYNMSGNVGRLESLETVVNDNSHELEMPHADDPTIALNDVVEPHMTPSALSHDAANLNNNAGDLTPDKTQSNDDSHELEMPHADKPTIPVNEVKSPDEATIPLNDVLEARMMPSALLHDAANLNNNAGYLTPDKMQSNDDSQELGMPHADKPTIPLNEVKSPDEATIPLNEVVEARMMPSTLSYDAPNLNNNAGYLTPDKTQSNDKNMNLGNMQMVSKQTPNKGFIFGMMPFYIKSTNGPDLRHYFFPGGKDELLVKGSLPAAGSAPDVSGTWLNIVGTNANPAHALLENNFQSTLQISPTYEYVGAHLHLRKQIGQYWSDVQLPIAQVSVDHDIKEYNMSGNVGRLESVVTFVNNANDHIKAYPTPLYSVDAASAFSQQSWQYHKLSKKPLKHVGMGDTTLKIGMNYGRTQFFTKFVLPTSQPRTNAFMFEPQLGNGGHVGMGGGVGWADVTTVSYLGADVGLQAELEGTYLFSNVQMRTFDVTSYGAFSRFLQFKIPNDPTGFIPSYAGVNTLTKKTTVSPVGEVNALLASSFIKNDVQLGLTYSLHCTMPESLKISDAFIDTYGVASTLGDVAGDTAPIKFVLIPSIEGSAAVPGAGAPGKKISIEDLDLDSAARPLTATSQIAASFGFAKKILHEDVGIHCIYGMSINHNNATLSTWLIALQVALKL